MATKLAINGFGRIGRNVLRALMEQDNTDLQVIAINDLAPVGTNAHLFEFDSVHGRYRGRVTVEGDTMDVGQGPIRVSAERDPARYRARMHRHLCYPCRCGQASGKRGQAGTDLGPWKRCDENDRLWRQS